MPESDLEFYLRFAREVRTRSAIPSVWDECIRHIERRLAQAATPPEPKAELNLSDLGF